MTILQTPTNHLPHSLDFYAKLGFQKIEDEHLTLVTDGIALIEINPDRFARAGVKLFQNDWTKTVAALTKETAVTTISNGYLLADPSGVWIYLLENIPDIADAKANHSGSVLGNCAGLSLETTDLAKSAKIWELLGFEKTMGDLNQGWVAFKNADDFGVSLMKPYSCPHLFFNPSLTYFNGRQNEAIIEKIRNLGIPITEEITYFNKKGEVDNIIIRDPGGFGFFIFND